MTEKLYREGKLRQREACSIVLNFSILSIPMIIYTSEELNLNKLNLILISVIILIITNIILSKSYLLNKKKKSYYIKTWFRMFNIVLTSFLTVSLLFAVTSVVISKINAYTLTTVPLGKKLKITRLY